ncbi:MAG TPA: nickel-dependent lactate racemase [Chloroflexota bacterium]|nr:nickel-dependent lactate racemase [Chloroflexota bacterium]
MRVKLAYGRAGMTVNMPDNRTTIIEPLFMPSIPDEAASVEHALRHPIRSRPLREVISSTDTVAVVFCDITRPMPSSLVLPIVLQHLDHVPREQIVLICATGTHRANTKEELEQMLGADIVCDYRIVCHDGADRSTQTMVGRLDDGTEVWLSSELVKAGKVVLTGFIEPHFFAGFSGGPKMIAPGCAANDTILSLHSAKLIADPKATWGVTDGNPLWEKICQAARFVDVAFNLNVTINKRHQVTNVFAGEMWQSHRIGVEFARKTAMRGVSQAFDVVVTTNAGYPLDMNLYQTVKGMSAAAQIVRPGGVIVVASECSDGIPEHGNFKKLLRQAGSPDALLAMLTQPDFAMQDQWEAQILAQVLKKARVYLKAGFLSDQQIRDSMLTPINSVEDCVNEVLEEMGPNATVGVLPQGPFTIPFIQAREPLAIA